MKLYDSKFAPNPRRVRIFLAEKGIEVPTEQVVRYESELLRHIRADKQALLADIRDQKDISKNGKDGAKIEDTIKATLEAFGKTFA